MLEEADSGSDLQQISISSTPSLAPSHPLPQQLNCMDLLLKFEQFEIKMYCSFSMY